MYVCVYVCIYVCAHACARTHTHTYIQENVPDFRRMFLKLKYTDITKNTYIGSWTVTYTAPVHPSVYSRVKCIHAVSSVSTFVTVTVNCEEL